MSTPVRNLSRSINEREDLSACPRRLLGTSLLASIAVASGIGSQSACRDVEEEPLVQGLSALQLERVCAVEEPKFPELQFSRGYTFDNSKQVLIVTHRRLADHPPFGSVSRVRIELREDGSYVVHILMRNLEQGVLQDESEVHDLLERFSTASMYKFCPGIEWSYYHEHYYNAIRFHIKSVRCTETPFQRIDSVNCKMWFKLPMNASLADKNSTEAKCPACKRLCSDLEWQLKRTAKESPSRKVKRQAASSRARLTYMSPNSRVKRKQNASMERGIAKRKLAKYENTELTLADEQHTQMCDIVNIIDGSVGDDLQKIFEEGETHGVSGKLKEIWMTDRRQNIEQFKQDQARNVTGKRSNQWSMITIRMALAIFTRSPSAYEALKNFDVLQPPSRSLLQSYTGAFLHDPGTNSRCIADQVAQYVLFKAECEKMGKHPPKSDGVLVFDEVKVACQLMWNSRSQTLTGLAMTSKDLSSLTDVYQLLQTPQTAAQTSYILQFLWRDLTSSYDIVGPYFTRAESVDCKFVITCVMETIRLFQQHGLKTSLLMCDGCAANLTAIKSTHGVNGAYSVLDDSTTDRFKIKPWFINPYNPPDLIFWMICPTHQLKNMINALFSSKSGGTKQFQRGKEMSSFGWTTIVDMYNRDVSRARQQQTRMVPRLKEVHVLRDAWTKLNVSPAKIMQQEQVLTELYSYIHQDPSPPDVATTIEAHRYLEACNLIFERGFLCHEKVTGMDSSVLKNISNGFDYFSSWISNLLSEDKSFSHTSNTQKAFLSWQTWDLLRIDVYGFKAFCGYFFEKHPGYFIAPLRISGSSVESLFSQFKHNAGGKLDACNYATARCAHLVKQSATGHHSGAGYRDQTLSCLEIPLQKKKYGTT